MPGGSAGSVVHAAGLCLYRLSPLKAVPAKISGFTTLRSEERLFTERRVLLGSSKGEALLVYLRWE